MSLITPDTYDKLFLRCDNVTTSNSTLFLDSSTSNTKTVSTNGNAIQLVSKFNRTAGFFNGTSDGVSIPDSADWDFSGDFSVQFYANWTTVGPQICLIDIGEYASSKGFTIIYGAVAGNLTTAYNGSVATNYAFTPVANTWYKINFTRISGTAQMKVDDVQKGSDLVNSTSLDASTYGVKIGYNRDGNYFPGWIKNLTVTKAGATVLDMRFDNCYEANSALPLGPLGPAIAFDGTGDYIQVPAHADFAFTGQFTVEFFVNESTLANCTYADSGWASNKGLTLYHDGTNLQAGLNGGSLGSFARAWPKTAGKWSHVAFTRDGSDDCRLFVDGVQLGAVYNKPGTIDGTVDYTFGYRSAGTAVNGFMREIRISDTCRYASAFTPSQIGWTVDGNTKLYIKGNQANGTAGTSILDSNTSPKTVTCQGDAKIKYYEVHTSCVFKDDSGTTKYPYPVGSCKVDFFSAFGTGVAFLDGAGGTYISSVTNADFALDADFTVEGYIRLDSHATESTIFCIKNSSTLWLNYHTASGGRWDYITTGGAEYPVYTLPLKTWAHIAWIRSSGSVKLFINGIQLGSGYSDATSLAQGAIYLGAYNDGTIPITGRMDLIRVTKGTSRYTTTFNPPEDVQTTMIKKISGVSYGSVKKVSGLAVASVKKVMGVA